ncbi:DUF4097 family beta strand repeat-containing protein [Paenibacillaceae bacterium WGS1546]|uniref:DUF4097 family beta strand repeat-containing protein n=1 Tax=Cohnella sp. WGS1546 TaxID=3366810 RepID=UPI00372D5BF5
MRKAPNIAKIVAIAVLAAAITGCGEATSAVSNFAIGEGSGSGELVSLEKKEFERGEFDKLDVRTEAMEVYVEAGPVDKAEVELLVDDTIENKFQFDAKVQSGALTVKVEEGTKSINLSRKGQAGERKLRITLPDEVYKHIRIQNNFGQVQADDVRAEAVDIKVDAGKIGVNRGSGALKLAANAGEIVVQGIRLEHDVQAKTDVGEIAIHLAESPKEADLRLKSEVGSVKASLEHVDYSVNKTSEKVGSIGKSGAKIDASASVGEIVVDVQR